MWTHYKINLLLNKYHVGYWDISWVKHRCVELKNVIINGSLIPSVIMSMGKFRTEPQFYPSACCRLCFFIFKISNKQLNWVKESDVFDAYILFSRIHSFIIYQISLKGYKSSISAPTCERTIFPLPIITFLTPRCSHSAPCSVCLAWCNIYAFWTEVIGVL